MNLSIKTKLTLIIISVSLITGMTITLGFSVHTLQQSAQNNRLQLDIACRAFTERLVEQDEELDRAYTAFVSNQKLNANMYFIASGGLLEYHMIPELGALGVALGVDRFAYYSPNLLRGDDRLQLYYARHLKGNVTVSDSVHRLYARGAFGSTLIENAGLFAAHPPENKDRTLISRDNQVFSQSWHAYTNFVDRADLSEGETLGTFCLQAPVSFNIDNLGRELGVDFTIYDHSGRVVRSTVLATNLGDTPQGAGRYLTLSDTDDNLYDSMLLPIVLGGEPAGFLSANIPVRAARDSIARAIALMSVLSAGVVVLILVVSHYLVRKFTAPIIELTNASIEMAGGNLARIIEITSQDELGVLAGNFAKMRDAISDHILKLNNEIGERTRSEEALRESEQRFRTYYELGLIGMAQTSATKGWTHVNSRLCEILGYPQEELMQKTWAELTHPDDLEIDLAHFERVVAGETDGYSLDKRFIRKDGEIIHASISVGCIRKTDGSIDHFVALVQDITERKVADEKIKSDADRFERWQASNFIGILQSNDAGDILEANDAMLDMLGYTRQELIEGELEWTQLTPPEFAYLDAIAISETADQGYWRPFEKEYLHKDGRRIPILIGGSMFKEDPGEYIAFVIDLTSKKLAEDDVREAQNALLDHQRHETELVEAKLAILSEQLVHQTRLATIGQMTASIAHEIRNPLGAVRNAAYYLKHHVANDNPKYSQYLGIIDQEVHSADDVIRNMLQMARAKEPVKSTFDLALVVHEVFDRIDAVREIKYVLETVDDPFDVVADKGQLRQVFVNMVNNAAQAVRDGGIIRVVMRRDQSHDLIDIEDNGHGVSAEHREKLFEPLFTTRAKGTGLGLAICREIIELHGGTIELCDIDGPGTRFSIMLPHPESADTQDDRSWQ
jgi:PAS domain S-box-containing protein